VGKKTTLAKDRKAKPATKAGKKPSKAKASPTVKKADNRKLDEKVQKPKRRPSVAAKSVEKSSSPKSVAAQKGDKTSGEGTVKIVARGVAEAPKSNTKALAVSKIGARAAAPTRAPREIGGLPKIPAVRGVFDRVPKSERQPARDEDSGGNGDAAADNAPTEPTRTYLTDEELREFRDLLIAKRQEIIRDVTNLEDEAIRQASSGATTSTMPIHMADLGTDTWEQELTLGLIENERSLLREIDEALERVDNKTYGMCIATNKRISKSRLQAKPWAKYCIEYARKRELGLA